MARVAMGVLGWAPDVFWGATPADFRFACEGRFPPPELQPASREELSLLMRKFPDRRL